jgi:hypothetical protein
MRPTLKHRDERQVGVNPSQVQVVLDGSALVFEHGKTGLLDHMRLAHPVLRGCPVEVTNFIAEAAHLGHVGLRLHHPSTELAQLREPTRV